MVSLKEIFEMPELAFLKLKTDKEYLKNEVSGVNRFETKEDIYFIRRNEIVVMTGVYVANEPNELIDFIKILIEKTTLSAIVLNVGPYIKAIPSEIITLANKKEITIFEMPWRMRVANFTTIVTKHIFEKEKVKELEKQYIKNILLNEASFENLPIELRQQVDAQPFDKYSVIVIKSTQYASVNMKELMDLAQRELVKIYPLQLASSFYDSAIFLVNEKKDNYSEVFPLIAKKLQKILQDYHIVIGKGEGHEITRLYQSYQEALLVLSIYKEKAKSTIFSYNELGVYKLLFQLYNKEALKEFHDEALGPLIKYDRDNHQDLHEFLSVYIQENGKIGDISKRLFLHRNTVLYRMERIDEIIGVDLKNLSDITYISLALYIESLPDIDIDY